MASRQKLRTLCARVQSAARRAFFGAPRVHASMTARSDQLSPRVLTVQDGDNRVRSRRVHGLAPESPGIATVDHLRVEHAEILGSDVYADDQRLIQMRAIDHVEEFLRFMLDWAREEQEELGLKRPQPLVFTHVRILQQYAGWAFQARVVPLPDLTILTLLKNDPRVTKKRGTREKDENGRVKRSANGTPIRPVTYSIKVPRRDALPGKVPVRDVVRGGVAQPVRRAA